MLKTITAAALALSLSTPALAFFGGEQPAPLRGPAFADFAIEFSRYDTPMSMDIQSELAGCGNHTVCRRTSMIYVIASYFEAAGYSYDATVRESLQMLIENKASWTYISASGFGDLLTPMIAAAGEESWELERIELLRDGTLSPETVELAIKVKELEKKAWKP